MDRRAWWATVHGKAKSWTRLRDFTNFMKVKSESEDAQSIRLLATPWTVAYQAPPSLGFSRQEHWSGLPFPSPMHACMLSRFSRVQLCATPWTAAHQAPPSTGFCRQEYWSGLPFPSLVFLAATFKDARSCKKWYS